MAKTASKGKAAGGQNDKASSRPVKLAFDIEAENLPKAIDEKAFASGGYPYNKKYKRKHYEKELEPLQIELLKLLAWARSEGERIVIVFEGRDGAGKGGAIARFTQHLNPRHARVVALSKPSDVEQGQWYFQRYAARMPSAGELVFFDRSWYNRAGVESAMGFATPRQTADFLREAPAFEGMLTRDGIRLVKFFQAIPRFDDYSAAFERMLAKSSTDWAPWTVVRANDKFRTRLNAIRHVLRSVPYKDKDEAAIGEIDRRIVLTAEEYLANGGES